MFVGAVPDPAERAFLLQNLVIDENAARATADAIIGDGGSALALRCDVTRIDDVQRLAAQAQAWFDGPPTLVINNAGVGAGGTPIGETSLDDWSWVLGINLWGPINGCHVFTPILREAGSGQLGGIINVASAAAFGAAPGMAAYNVSKAGVLSLRDSGRRTVRHRNRRHRAVSNVRQDQHRRIRPNHRAIHRSRRPADAPYGVLPRPGCAHVPRHPRPRRPVLHASARCPIRLAYQAVRTRDLHPRRRPDQPRDDPIALTRGGST